MITCLYKSLGEVAFVSAYRSYQIDQ